MPRKKELTLVAAKKPQLKKRAKRDWSKAKARKFLSVLGDTCNVSEACRQSGVPMTVVYRRRKMDAAFRAAWVETIGCAYQQLELELLNRAFNGTEKVMSGRAGSGERMREQLPLSPRVWRVEQSVVDGFVVKTSLRPSWVPSAEVLGDSGRIVANPDVAAGATEVGLLDLPTFLSQPSWLDEIDAPLGEAREQYRVTITGTASATELISDHPAISVSAAELQPLGPGQATVEVRQIGDAGASSPARLGITLS